MQFRPKFAIMLAPAFILAGCASSGSPSMDVGQRIAERGGAIANYGEEWTAGRKDVERGEKMVSDSARNLSRAEQRVSNAQRDLERAQGDVRDAQAERVAGERLIVDGTAKMQRAEADYRAIRANSAIGTAD